MTGSTTCGGPVERDSGSDSVSPRKDDKRASKALDRVADVVALHKPFDTLDEMRLPVDDQRAVDVRFAVGVVVAHLGDVTLGVLENEPEMCHGSCSLARPGVVARSGQGERRSCCLP